MIRIGWRSAKVRAVAEVQPLRFENCCGAPCDESCRRHAMHEAIVRRAPIIGLGAG